MASSKLEDVARAIGERLEALDPIFATISDSELNEAARAAVEALLPPDEAMIEAGICAMARDDPIPMQMFTAPEAKALFVAGFTAALSSILNPAKGE